MFKALLFTVVALVLLGPLHAQNDGTIVNDSPDCDPGDVFVGDGTFSCGTECDSAGVCIYVCHQGGECLSACYPSICADAVKVGKKLGKVSAGNFTPMPFKPFSFTPFIVMLVAHGPMVPPDPWNHDGCMDCGGGGPPPPPPPPPPCPGNPQCGNPPQCQDCGPGADSIHKGTILKPRKPSKG